MNFCFKIRMADLNFSSLPLSTFYTVSFCLPENAFNLNSYFFSKSAKSCNKRVENFTSSLPCAQPNSNRLALSLSEEIGDQGHAPSLAADHQQMTMSCKQFIAR